VCSKSQRRQTLHVILTLFLTHYSLAQNKSHLCLSHAFYPFVTFVESGTLDYIQTISHSLIQVSHLFQDRLLFLNLPRCQLDRLQLILNSAAPAALKKPSLQPYLTHPQIFTLAQN